MELVKHAYSGVEAIDGTTILPDNVLARNYPLGVETVYMDDIVDICFLETFVCLSTRGLSQAQ